MLAIVTSNKNDSPLHKQSTIRVEVAMNSDVVVESPMLEERLLLPEDLPPGLEKVYRSLLHADPVQMRRQTLLGDGGDDALDHNGDLPLQPGGILAQLVLVLGHCDHRDT